MPAHRLRRPTHRTHQNPVTGQLEVTQLDAVRLAFERAVGAIDRERLRLTSNAERYRLVACLQAELLAMIPHTDGE